VKLDPALLNKKPILCAFVYAYCCISVTLGEVKFRYVKSLRQKSKPKFGLRLNLRLNLTSRQRLGVFLD